MQLQSKQVHVENPVQRMPVITNRPQ